MSGFPDLDAVTREGERTWVADESIRKEFRGSKENYLAFVKADAKGLCRVLPGRVTSSHPMVQMSAPAQQAPSQQAVHGQVIAYPIEARLAAARRKHLSEIRATD